MVGEGLAIAFRRSLLFYIFVTGTKFIHRKMEPKKIVYKTKKAARNISNHLHKRSAIEILVREMTEASNHSIKEDDLIKISSVPIEHSQNFIKFLDQAAKTYNIHKIYKIVEIITYLVLN